MRLLAVGGSASRPYHHLFWWNSEVKAGPLLGGHSPSPLPRGKGPGDGVEKTSPILGPVAEAGRRKGDVE